MAKKLRERRINLRPIICMGNVIKLFVLRARIDFHLD